jgi:phage gp36-like protein
MAQNPPQQLTACGDDASGIIDSALMAGARYQPSDLAGLTGTALSLLKRVCCDIWMLLLMQRRPDRTPERLEAQQKLAESYLERLAGGENVLAIPAAIEAGLQAITGPTCVDVQAINLTVDHCRPHYYPHRRLPAQWTRNL